MISIGLGLLEGLGAALLNGDNNIISQLVEQKLEELGSSFIKDFIGQEIPGSSAFNRFQRTLTTGGASEFDRARQSFLNQFRPSALPGSGLLRNLEKVLGQAQDQAQQQQPGKNFVWSKSRQQWLDKSWQHDWRSQPRDERGRWIKGRLKYPYVSRKLKKQRRGYRRAARKAIRGF